MDGDRPLLRRPTAVLVALAAAACAAVLGPVLVRRGYVLSYDMVFVPDPPVSARVLGTDGGAPRAVPSDLAVVVASWLVPGEVVQKAVLVAIRALAVVGAGRLALRFDASRLAAVCAALVYGWSPYLAERLVLGQWALLLGFAALPWAVAAALDVAEGRPGGLARLCAWTVPAAVGGGNATVLLVLPVLVVLLSAGRHPVGAVRTVGAGRTFRPAAAYTGFVALTALPWVLPAVLRPGGLPSDPASVRAFAAAADTPLGTALSLATLGGIWNQAVVPAERANTVLAVAALVALVAVLAAGLPVLIRQRPAGPGLLTAGLLGLALPALLATGPGRALLGQVVVHVPGGGLLRDTQKLLAGWVLLVAVLAALAVDRARRAVAPLRLGATVAVAAAVLPVALLPSLAGGASGRLTAAPYPPSWYRARAVLDRQPAGDVVVLPWAPYRRLSWAGGHVVLDPAQRVSGRTVVVDDRLPLRTGTVAGESDRAGAVTALLDGVPSGPLSAALRGLGFRYVLLHTDAPGADALVPRLEGATLAAPGPGLALYVLDDGPVTPAASTAPAGGRATVQVGGLVVAMTVAVGSLAVSARGARRRRIRDAPDEADDAAPLAG